MEHHLVLRIIARLLLPMILLFGLYIQFHGDYGPGGGFQAGVVFASGLVLYGLIAGLRRAQKILPLATLRLFMSLGLLLYIGVGLVCIAGGGAFLDYDALPIGGQHLGIMLVELGVGMTVASAMILFFHVFAHP